MKIGLFRKLVTSSFSFIVTEFGFALIRETDFKITYRSDKVSLSIYYDSNRSHELGVVIQRIGQNFDENEAEYTLGQVLRAEGVPDSDIIDKLQVSDAHILEGYIKRLATLVRVHTSEHLLGQRRAFERLAIRQEQETNAYASDIQLNNVRRDLDAAWQKRDYPSVVMLLTPYQDELSASEVAKLTYAKNKLKKV